MLALALLIMCVSTLASTSPKPIYDLTEAEHLFEQFIQDYNRQYASEKEKLMRFDIFKQTLREINRKNMIEDEHAVFGINQFADVTREEIKSYTGLLPTSPQCTCLLNKEEGNRCNVPPTPCETVVIGDGWSDGSSGLEPDSFDWRDYNAVSPVKYQSHCGSCWAFSTIGCVESQYAIEYKKIVTFSEQQLVDCDKANHGCHGGLLNASFGGLLANGVMTDTDYPYRGKEGPCKFDANKVKAKLTKCFALDIKNEERLKLYLFMFGPLSIAINAQDIMNYEKGIVKSCDGSKLDHGVLLVGYGTEDGLPYWIIKNSWSSRWGEKGYVRIQRGKNLCGIQNPCAASAQFGTIPPILAEL